MACQVTDDIFIYAMLERVVAFQERRHAAWDSAAPFASRIAGLLLYALEFNNPDRDPHRYGPTVAHYSPARCEVLALARMCQALSRDSTVLDIGCGNGFVGSLLAREGIRVIGIDDLSWKRPQIESFYDPDAYEMRAPCRFSNFSGEFEVALCSWMAPGKNMTAEIVQRAPALLIHVLSPDLQDNGLPTTGCPEAYACPASYVVLGRWHVITPPSYFSAVDSRFTSNGRKHRVVEVWRRHDVDGVYFVVPEAIEDEYDWQLEREGLNRLRLSWGLEAYEVPSRAKSR